MRKLTGCRSAMVAPLTVGENGAITFQAPQPILGLEEFNYSYTYAEASNFADNQQNIYKKKVTGVDIGLVFSELALKMEALLMGKTYSKGTIATSTTDQTKPVALLFQETYDDGSFINKVFYNTKLSKDESSGKTEGESLEFTPANLVGKAIPLPSGLIDYSIDSADETVDSAKLEAWFTTVQMPGTPAPTK
ncbi:MAG: major tail protein [Clostridium sp.]